MSAWDDSEWQACYDHPRRLAYHLLCIFRSYLLLFTFWRGTLNVAFSLMWNVLMPRVAHVNAQSAGRCQPCLWLVLFHILKT